MSLQHGISLRSLDLAEVFAEVFPDVRPPRYVSKIGVDRPGLLVSIAMVAVTDEPYGSEFADGLGGGVSLQIGDARDGRGGGQLWPKRPSSRWGPGRVAWTGRAAR